jgi:tetratricopeptide (TPR) repeat protein
MRARNTLRERIPFALLIPGVLLVACALLLAGAFLAPVTRHATRSPTAGPGTGSAADLAGQSAVALDTAISAAQDRLRRLPADWSTWAQLGSAYVEQARVTADPSYYPRAQDALERSLRLETATNWQAMVGMGTLANARHDFRSALDWGRGAQRVNPSAGSVYGVEADALTQLGEYPQARDAVQRMVDVAPGVSSFTRAAYDFEEHGQVSQAHDAVTRALADATDPSDIASCRYNLGELAFANGDLSGALAQYRAGIAADPGYQPAHAGVAKVDAALGRTAESLREYDQVVSALPLPRFVVEYGDVLTSAGRAAEAQRQYELLDTEQKSLASNAVADHLTAATFLADHGQPAAALTEARAEWSAGHSVLAADALAWALHRDGRDAEALTYATIATGLGWRNATFLYHRGAIEGALGRTDQARADLSEALSLNPHFDILQAPVARQLLTALDSAGG